MLVIGELPRKTRAEPGGQIALDLERDPDALSFRDGPSADEHELEVEQLVERQSPASPLGVLRRRRAMNRAEGIGQRWQPLCQAHRLRQGVFGGGDETVQMPLDEPAENLVAQSLGGGIHGKDLPRRERIGVRSGIGEDDELPGGELPAMVEPHRPGDQQRLAHLDAPVEEGLAGPDALEHSALVP